MNTPQDQLLNVINNPQDFKRYNEFEKAVIEEAIRFAARKWEDHSFIPITDEYDRWRDKKLMKR